jgi:hypothetical protein
LQFRSFTGASHQLMELSPAQCIIDVAPAYQSHD